MCVAYIDVDDLLPKISDLNKAGEKFTNIDKAFSLWPILTVRLKVVSI